MLNFGARARRLFAAAGCLTVPALLALGPSQAAFADTASGGSTTVTSTVSGTTSTLTSGLGLSSATKTASTTSTASKTAGTSSTSGSATNPPAAGCDAAISAGGLCVYTQGATVTADSQNGAWVSLCS